MPIVMLVCRPRLTFVIVALLIETLITVVSSAKTDAGATSGSEGFDPHATKSSQQNLNQFASNKVENSTMIKSASKMGASGTARYRNSSRGISNSSFTELQPLHGGGISSSRRHKKNKGVNKDKTEEKSSPFWSEDIQIGCEQLQARSYITDGFCTSEKPVKEVVCAGNCLPIMDMPWYAEFLKTQAKQKLKDWQCVDDLVRRKRVKLVCKNGTFKHYRIKVVKSCKCKKITNKHNKTSQQKKRRKDKKAKTNIGS